MFVESAERPRETAAPAGADELAEGLMLLRASTLKIVRLQLAIERHDRHVALEAVDELVALDRRLQDCLAGVTTNTEQVRRELDAERAALNQEKLGLAAEILLKPAAPLEESVATEELQPELANDDWLGPSDLQIEDEEPRRKRWWPVIVTVPILILAALVYFASFPDAAAGLADAARAAFAQH
jgi:hypothetical protein